MSDFICRSNNAPILFVQNSEEHCIAWFLTTVFTYLNLKHGETCMLSFKSSGKQDFLGLGVLMGMSANLPSNFRLPARVYLWPVVV